MDLAKQERVDLVAVDAPRNIAREYVIERSHDLFGFVLVSWRWGRIGSRGRERRAAFPSQREAEGFVRQLLARRATAPRRIGVSYRSR